MRYLIWLSVIPELDAIAIAAITLAALANCNPEEDIWFNFSRLGA